ncbi:MAG: cyclic pyranopterin monophosphate synthase MoaC [Armatimonadota bacterium]|nr:cyclic pyranopterin monophosphate synthase MoaC [Armatimonadota bacterium]
MDLTHLDEKGRARMVNVSEKAPTTRRAKAKGAIYLQESTLAAIAEGKTPKGDVFAAARIAGIMAAKRCGELIPLCHTIQLESVNVELRPRSNPARVEIESEVLCNAKTGAEMEALVAVTMAALTIYDMVKAIDRGATIGDIRLAEKSGGKSGRFVREEEV